MYEASMKHDKTRGLTQSRTSLGSCFHKRPGNELISVTRRARLRAQTRSGLSADALALLSVEDMVAGMSVNDSDCHESCDGQCGE